MVLTMTCLYVAYLTLSFVVLLKALLIVAVLLRLGFCVVSILKLKRLLLVEGLIELVTRIPLGSSLR